MMSSGWVTQSDCIFWNHPLEPFPNKETKQKGPQATYPLTVLNPLPWVFEVEGFFSYPLPEPSEHPSLPLVKSLDFFDLSSLCSFLIFSSLHVFYKHASRAHMGFELTLSHSYLAPDPIAPTFMPAEAPQY